MQDINSKRFLRIRMICKDRKITPYKLDCCVKKLAEHYYDNYNEPFEQYDKVFTEKYLKDEGGQKVWKI